MTSAATRVDDVLARGMARVLSAVPDGVVAVVKRSCPTCDLVSDALVDMVESGDVQRVVVQDDDGFPAGLAGDDRLIDDRCLDFSFHCSIETVPTLLRVEDGAIVDRSVGWSHDSWTSFFSPEGVNTNDRFASLPPFRPGCGALNVEPGTAEALAVRFGATPFTSRHVEFASAEDEIEAMFDRGWTDGLPVVPPTAERVLRMLAGTSRSADEVVAVVPPNLVECTVEKVAINAVLAGCKPEYLPIVLTAVEAACTTTFNAHGLLATTYFAGPVVVVNGPIARSVGMNSGVNVFGQGNRANSTIGRALQLVIRNVGGGKPGGVDRATFGHPGKIGFCFSESEESARSSGWSSLAEERGIDPGVNAITLFAGEGPRAIIDQKSRNPESLAASIALAIRSVGHPKLPMVFDAIVAVSPEHLRTFAAAGWDRVRTREEILSRLQIPAQDLAVGAGGIAEGIPSALADDIGAGTLAKFRPESLLFVHCGGDAGMFSAVIGGWTNGTEGSTPITKEITPWL